MAKYKATKNSACWRHLYFCEVVLLYGLSAGVLSLSLNKSIVNCTNKCLSQPEYSCHQVFVLCACTHELLRVFYIEAFLPCG